MEQRTQNLFLFFEETDDEKDISSNLVHLYMNRSVMAEEEQSEIIGVYNLAKPNKDTPLIEFYSQESFLGETCKKTQFWKENRTKLEHDEALFEKIGSEIASDVKSVHNFSASVTKEKSMNHFIIGSSFYTNSSKRRRIFVEKIMRDLTYEIDSQKKGLSHISIVDKHYGFYGLKNLHNDVVINQTLITMLRGSHRNLLTAEQLKIAQAQSEVEPDLINDDLEEFHKLTMVQGLRFDEFRSLSFYKELTDPELDKLKPFQYEIDLQKQNWASEKSLEALLPLLAQTDPGYQYLQCDCQRYTFSVLFPSENVIRYYLSLSL